MDSKGEIVIYKSPKGETQLEVSLKDETVWLSQKTDVKFI